MNKRTPLSARLIRQSWIAALAMLAMIAISLIDPLHDPVTQHMSEIVAGSWWSAIAIRVLPAIAGVSVMAFGFGCFGRDAVWSGFTALLFGAAMLANGVFPTGDPRHGLYGLAIFSVLVPAFYASETNVSPALKHVSFAASFVALLYLWGLLIGLDQPEYRGVTQRIASLVAFGWFLLPARGQFATRSKRKVASYYS